MHTYFKNYHIKVSLHTEINSERLQTKKVLYNLDSGENLSLYNKYKG